MYNKFSFLNRNLHSFYENNNLNKDIFGNRRVNFMSVSAAGGASNLYPTQQQNVTKRPAQQVAAQDAQQTGQHGPSQVYTPTGATRQTSTGNTGVNDTMTQTISSVAELPQGAYLPPDVYAALARGDKVQVTLTERPADRVNLLVPLFALGAQMLMSSGSAYSDKLADAIQGVVSDSKGNKTANVGTGLNAAAAFVNKYGNDYSLNPFGGASHIDVDAQYKILRKKNNTVEPQIVDPLKRPSNKEIKIPKLNEVPYIPAVTSDSPSPEGIKPIAPPERKPKPTTIGDILDKKDFRLMTTEGYKGKFDINLAAQATGIPVEDLQKLITDSNLDISGTNEKFAISFLNKYGDVVINDGVGPVLVKDKKNHSLERPIGDGEFKGQSAVITDMDNKAAYTIFINKDTGKFDKTGEARAKAATRYINAGFVSGAFDGGVGNFEPSTRHHDNPAAYAKKVADAQAVFNKPEYKGKSVGELLTIAKNDPKKAPEIYSSLFLQAENNTHVENGMYGAGHIGKMQEAMVDRANVFVDGSRAISNIYNKTPLNDEEKKGLGDLVALYNKSNSPAINIDLNNPQLSDQDALKLVGFSEKGLNAIKTELEAGFKDAHYNLAVLNVQIPNIQKGIEGLKSRIQDNSKPAELPKAVEQYNNISAKYSQIIDAVKSGKDSLPDGTKVSDAITSLKKDVESLGAEGLSGTIGPNVIENLNKKVSELENFASGKSVNGDKLVKLNNIIAQLDKGKPLSEEQKKFINDNKDFIASTKSSDPNVPVTAESILSANDKIKEGGIITGSPESKRTIELSEHASSLSKIYNDEGESLIKDAKKNQTTGLMEGGTLSEDAIKLKNYLNTLVDPNSRPPVNYKLDDNDMIKMIRGYGSIEASGSIGDDSEVALSAEKPEGKAKIDKFNDLNLRYNKIKDKPINQENTVEMNKIQEELNALSTDIATTKDLSENEKASFTTAISKLENKIQPSIGVFNVAIKSIKKELNDIVSTSNDTQLKTQIQNILDKQGEGNDLIELEKLANGSEVAPNQKFVKDIFNRLDNLNNRIERNEIGLNSTIIVGGKETTVKDYIKNLESEFSSFLKESKSMKGISKEALSKVTELFNKVNKTVGALGEDINAITTDIMNGIKKADQVIGKSSVDFAIFNVQQSSKENIDENISKLIDELSKSAQTNKGSAVANFQRADKIISETREQLNLPASTENALFYAYDAASKGSEIKIDKGNMTYTKPKNDFDKKNDFVKLLQNNLQVAKKDIGGSEISFSPLGGVDYDPRRNLFRNYA